MPNERILVVEDEQAIVEIVSQALKRHGFDVATANDGDTALDMAYSLRPDLIILDIMLPRMDGWEVCRRLKSEAETKNIPIIMLTARREERDVVEGLDLGADDYIKKPFSLAELMARVKAIFRRINAVGAQTGEADSPKISLGKLVIETDKRKVTLADKKVVLTAKEYDLLLHFASHPGRVYSRAQLLDQVWGYGYEGYEHTVNSHINRLRGKIEVDPANPEYVLTVWGVGYRFAEPQELQ